MKYRPAQYAHALHAALTAAPATRQKTLLRSFTAMLARHRMLGKSDLIVAAYEKIARSRSNTRNVRIESAAPASAALKKEIAEILGNNIELTQRVRRDLLAGVKILVDDEMLIDASAKRQLERIFQSK